MILKLFLDLCSGQDGKSRLYFCLKQLKETHTKYIETKIFKTLVIRQQRTIILTDKKQTWDALIIASAYCLTSHKVEFPAKVTTMDKGYLIIMKESINPGHNFIQFMHLINNSKCRKQNLIELQWKIDKFTLTVRDFNSPLSITDRTQRWKTSKDMEVFNNIISHLS